MGGIVIYYFVKIKLGIKIYENFFEFYIQIDVLFCIKFVVIQFVIIECVYFVIIINMDVFNGCVIIEFSFIIYFVS